MTRPPTFFGNKSAPSLDDIAAIAEAALATIPAQLAAHTADLVIGVEELCDGQIERQMGLDSPYELLGLYQGRPLDRKSNFDVVQDVDRIFLYRQAVLLFWAESDETLEDIVRNLMIHEIGHHFGLSDEDMEALENEETATGNGN